MNGIKERLKKESVDFIKLAWCDLANSIRAKAFHTNSFDAKFEHGIGLTPACQGFPGFQDYIVPDTKLKPVGEMWLTPDWQTLQMQPYTPGMGRVLVDIKDGYNDWSLCSRTFLKKMIKTLKNDYNIEFKASVENEFYLLKQNEDKTFSSVDDFLYADASGLDFYYEILSKISNFLMVQGVEIEAVHPECGPGQLELSVKYCHALKAADNQIILRETVKAVAREFEYTASFLPKIFKEYTGNGCHLHFSLWKDEKNISVGNLNNPISGISENFVAGVLKHLSSLIAITASSVNSYDRFVPSSWSGAYTAWGLDNREAAIRVPSFADGTCSNIELKTFDASSNPYLALGAIIACGIDGIENDLKLPEPVNENPDILNDQTKRELNIARLPKNLGEALKNLSTNKILKKAMGEELYNVYSSIKVYEWDTLKKLSFEEQVKLLICRY